MTDGDLKVIEAHLHAAKLDPWLPGSLNVSEIITVYHSDVPALLAEVRRLQAELVREDKSHGDTIDARDRAEGMADELAERIVALTVGGDSIEAIGEHTSANDPWRRAMQLADEHLDVTAQVVSDTDVYDEQDADDEAQQARLDEGER
jgi:hypothetical protein